MEKLIELLNEREKTVNWVQYPWWCKEHLEYQCHWPRVINKRFWFIKRLVENDKIDTDVYKTVYSGDLDKRKTLTMSSGWDEFYQVTEHWAYESLLMLLAISDTPIDLLCEILKDE